MSTRKFQKATIGVGLAVALLITGCTAETAPEVTPEPATPAGTVEPTQPTETETPEPTETVEPEPVAYEGPTEAGATVPADQVEAARAQGVGVVVLPGSTDGVVVTPENPLPGPVRDAFAPIGTAPKTLDEEAARLDGYRAVRDAYMESGVPVGLVRQTGIWKGETSIGTEYAATVLNTPNMVEVNGALGLYSSAAEAEAALRAVIGPDIQIIDLTS